MLAGDPGNVTKEDEPQDQVGEKLEKNLQKIGEYLYLLKSQSCIFCAI